jgi:hypothetical protein
LTELTYFAGLQLVRVIVPGHFSRAYAADARSKLRQRGLKACVRELLPERRRNLDRCHRKGLEVLTIVEVANGHDPESDDPKTALDHVVVVVVGGAVVVVVVGGAVVVVVVGSVVATDTVPVFIMVASVLLDTLRLPSLSTHNAASPTASSSIEGAAL